MIRFVRSSLALRKFRKSADKEVDLSELIPVFLKNGKSGVDYQYRAFLAHGRDIREFYFDAPYRIILECRRNKILDWTWIPIACVSFDKGLVNSICIKQIQGPSYADPEDKDMRIAALAEIKWERLLVRIVCEWAKANGIRRVELISCKKSSWYRDYRHQQMFIRYDVTARRMGFQKSKKEEGIYELNISDLKPLVKAA
ncbi:MAG: hypothetical protein HYT62_05080, partial [Candidatus Yanofskybacteria bacterium]|nr:hypothetical protein [Candidatus Yanofskybacteria bacterium]